MSQSELDEILEEIRTRGGSSSQKKATDDEVKEAMESFTSAMNPVEEEPLEIDIPAPKEDAQESDDLAEVDLFSLTDESENDTSDFIDDEPPSYEPKKKDKKKIIIPIIAVLLVVAIVASVCVVLGKKDKPVEEEPTTTTQTTTQPAPVVTGATNPLTGEADFGAVGKRPIAVSIDNEFSTSGIRPQWGIDQADIIFEAESESSTRVLMLFADYTKAPEKIGPVRSARPPFIRFSQLFDCIFVHAGLSHSKGNYVGADSVFINENVDHINLLSYSENSEFFGRDYSKTSVIEHTGYFNGTNASKLFEQAKIRTDVEDKDFAPLSFNTEPKDIGTEDGSYAYFDWSDRCGDGIEVIYVENEKAYQSSHFDSSSTGQISNCKWTNCIFLFDNTNYIVKENYKGSGNSETYCDYELAGGEGVVLSMGKMVNVQWGVADGKLWMKNKDTNEDVLLNPGKSYIALGSANHNGTITTTLEE